MARIHAFGWPVSLAIWQALSDYDMTRAFAALAGIGPVQRTPELYEMHIRRIGFSGLGTVLDAGCGFGQWTLPLARRNTTALGVDTSAERLSFAAGLVAGANQSNVNFQRARLEQLPLDDESVDGVFCTGVISFLDARVVLAEFGRVLRRGGRLYVTMNATGAFIRLVVERILKGEGGRRRYWLAVAAGVVGRRLCGLHDNYVVTEKRIHTMLAAAGFHVLAVTPLGRFGVTDPAEVRLSAAGLGPETYWGFPRILEVVAEKPGQSAP